MVGTAMMAAQPANFLEVSFCEIEINEKFASSAVLSNSLVLSTISLMRMA